MQLKTLAAIIFSILFYNNIATYDKNETEYANIKSKEISLLPETANLESRIKILLSPGHGPMDGIVSNVGTRVDDFTEFDANYEIYARLLKLLRNDLRFAATGLKDRYSYNEEFRKKFRLHFGREKNPDSLENLYRYYPSKIRFLNCSILKLFPFGKVFDCFIFIKSLLSSF